MRPDQAAAFTAAYGNGGTTNQIPQGTANQLLQLQGGNVNLRPEEAFAGYDPFNAEIGAQNYFDIAARYEVKQIELRAGINNVTDKSPSFLGSEVVGGGMRLAVLSEPLRTRAAT